MGSCGWDGEYGRCRCISEGFRGREWAGIAGIGCAGLKRFLTQADEVILMCHSGSWSSEGVVGGGRWTRVLEVCVNVCAIPEARVRCLRAGTEGRGGRLRRARARAGGGLIFR